MGRLVTLLILASFIISGSIETRAQALGKPFYRNFTSVEYNAHNRNFDIACDSTGRVYVANFEGLLVYGGGEWNKYHTPGISRITQVYVASDGQVWFGGNNVVGYVTIKDTTNVVFVSDELSTTHGFGEVQHFYEDKNQVCFTTSDNQAFRIDNNSLIPTAVIPHSSNIKTATLEGAALLDNVNITDEQAIAYATAGNGVIITNLEGKPLYSIDQEDGLCSNSVNAIAYDGKGSVWGATDNGIFRFSTSRVYTHYGEEEGLIGHVNCIMQNEIGLLVGTLQGLYYYSNGSFTKIEEVTQACWQLKEMSHKRTLAATANGVFLLEYSLVQLSQKHTLSICEVNDNTFLTGELDGIYQYNYQGIGERIDNIPNITEFQKTDNGTIWALDVYGKTYCKTVTDAHFTEKPNENLSPLFHYTDSQNGFWHAGNNGKGLNLNNADVNLEIWTSALSEYNIQAMTIYNDIAWIGGSFGLIRLNLALCKEQAPIKPKLYISSFSIDNRYLHASFANDKIDPLGQTVYCYRLHNNDAWSRWRTEQDLNIEKLPYGNYQLTVSSKDAFGQTAISQTIHFSIPYPIYMRWYAWILYLGIAAYLVLKYIRHRTLKLIKEQERLEQIVSERTHEVLVQKEEIESQKDEIEEKSHKLEDAIVQLKNTQQQLIRKEKEATVGKLTKGLIDRILNPMNYINNFSHLSLGLTKDMQGNLEDLEDSLNDSGDDDKEELQEVLEDSHDVLDMMKGNLEKIQQHGLSTTRILKAMEEMLQERSNKTEPTNIVALCSQNIEMLNKYYEQDIKALNIQVAWEKNNEEIISDVNAELLSKTIMSMLANSVYAIKKKHEKSPGYLATIKLSVADATSTSSPTITIHDNGIGIEASIVDKIFDPFFTTKPTAEAPGVGLYLSQQIVQDFGGNITVESTKNEYTKFTITLP